MIRMIVTAAFIGVLVLAINSRDLEDEIGERWRALLRQYSGLGRRRVPRTVVELNRNVLPLHRAAVKEGRPSQVGENFARLEALLTIKQERARTK